MSDLSEVEAKQLQRQSAALESIAKTLKAILTQLMEANRHRARSR